MTLPIQRVVAAVVRQGDALLVCQRPSHKRHAGLWEFPGGKCEADESDVQALARELLEELGLTVREIGDLLFEAADEGSQYLIAFFPVTVEGEPIAHEHEALKWATQAELLALPLAPVDRRFVEHGALRV